MRANLLIANQSNEVGSGYEQNWDPLVNDGQFSTTSFLSFSLRILLNISPPYFQPRHLSEYISEQFDMINSTRYTADSKNDATMEEVVVKTKQVWSRTILLVNYISSQLPYACYQVNRYRIILYAIIANGWAIISVPESFTSKVKLKCVRICQQGIISVNHTSMLKGSFMRLTASSAITAQHMQHGQMQLSIVLHFSGSRQNVSKPKAN